jgi:hypothetical protein
MISANHLKVAKMNSRSTESSYDFVTLESIGFGGLGHDGIENIIVENNRPEFNRLNEMDGSLPLLLCDPVPAATEKDLSPPTNAEMTPIPRGAESDVIIQDILVSVLAMLLLGAAAYSAWLLFTAP